MKKILLLAVLISASFAASAQNSSIEGFGFKGGLNIAGVTKVDDVDAKPSFYVGIFKEYAISNKVGLQPELVYSRQGFSLDPSGMDLNVRFNYINLPILVKLYATDKISFDLGPQFGYMLNAKIKGDVHSGYLSQSISEDFDDVYDGVISRKKFDVAFAFGMTFKTNRNIEFGIRWNVGITPVMKDLVYGDKSRNSVFQLGAGYRF